MPIVSKVQMYVPTIKGPTKMFLRVITVNAKGVFSVELPEYIAEVIGTKKVESNTLEAMDSLWEDSIAEYMGAMQQDREKFIRVRFSNSKRRHFQDTEERSFFISPDFSIGHELLFKIKGAWYHVTPDGGVGGYSYYDLDEREILLPWSKEYEDFFIQAEAGVDKLIDSVDAFLKKVKKNNKFLDKHLRQNLLGGR